MTNLSLDFADIVPSAEVKPLQARHFCVKVEPGYAKDVDLSLQDSLFAYFSPKASSDGFRSLHLLASDDLRSEIAASCSAECSASPSSSDSSSVDPSPISVHCQTPPSPSDTYSDKIDGACLTPPLCSSAQHLSAAYFPMPVTPPHSQIGFDKSDYNDSQSRISRRLSLGAACSPYRSPPSRFPMLRHKEAYLKIDNSPGSKTGPISDCLDIKCENDNSVEELTPLLSQLPTSGIGFAISTSPFTNAADGDNIPKLEQQECESKPRNIKAEEADDEDEELGFDVTSFSISDPDPDITLEDSKFVNGNDWPFQLECNGKEDFLSPLKLQGSTHSRSIGLSDGFIERPDLVASTDCQFPRQTECQAHSLFGDFLDDGRGYRRFSQQGSKRFVCDKCGKGFTQKGGLTNHARIHTGEKPFKCDECGRRFTQKCNLTRHLRVHTGEKPFQCMICSKRFNRKWGLVVHQRTHKGITM